MIVKVQKPVFFHMSEPDPAYFICDEDKILELRVPIGNNPQLDKLMCGYQKRYFHAKHMGTRVDIDFDKPCINKPWW